MSELSFFAPGKLVICGEYAVLAPGGEGLVAAVSAGVRATIRPSDHMRVSTPLLGGGPGKIVWDGLAVKPERTLDEEEQRGFRFIQAMLDEVFGYLQRGLIELRPFELELTPHGDPLGPNPQQPVKLGLGSSASATVAAGAALLAWHGIDATLDGGRDLLFQLARTAHWRAQQGHGSGIDIAASVYGGVIWFRADPGQPRVSRVEWPEHLRLVVGWTGQRIDTSPRVARIEAYWRENPRLRDQFVLSSRGWTRAIMEGLRIGDPASVLQGLARQRELLLELGERTGLPMEPEKLQTLAKVGARYGVAKQSGAGGGDCGILVLRSPSFLQPALMALRSSGLIPLSLQVPVGGVSLITRSRAAMPLEY